MDAHPILSQVVLGYSPMVDRQRSVVATRLTVFPDKPDAAPDPQALLAVLSEVWPAAEGEGGLSLSLRPLDGAAAPQRSAPGKLQPVSLNVAGEALLFAVIATQPPGHVMVEVPAFLATNADWSASLQALHAAGGMLLIKGRPLTELPRELLPLFSHSIVDFAEDRRVPGSAPPPGVQRGITTVQSGVHTLADVEVAFQRGAVATLGWPIDDPVAPTRASVPADVQVVMQLMQAVDREEPVARMEALLKRDPTIAFRLMRYLNSAAFGLKVEITSFGHALMMLGYQKLKRWLALLLASSMKDANAKPAMFGAVRRGLLMEELGRQAVDADARGELFICGVFSLLDRLLKQPFPELLKNLPVPERVQQALVGDGGAFGPYLELVRAIEQESVFDIRERADALFMSTGEVNRALLTALAAARALD
jgi:EAL and modified HD-GYP domain-containing signal transduction protein